MREIKTLDKSISKCVSSEGVDTFHKENSPPKENEGIFINFYKLSYLVVVSYFLGKYGLQRDEIL